MAGITTTWQILQDTFLFLDPDKGPEKGLQIKEKFKDVEGLAIALGSSCENGLPSSDDYDARTKIFGENSFATPPLATYLELFLETFKDPVLLILLFAVVIALVVGLIDDLGVVN